MRIVSPFLFQLAVITNCSGVLFITAEVEGKGKPYAVSRHKQFLFYVFRMYCYFVFF